MTDTSEPTTRSDAERRAALAALAMGAEQSAPAAEAPVVNTGRTVECGGEEARLLIRKASSLGYPTPKGYQRCGAVPGDVVLLSKGEASRLDALGVTVDPDTDLGTVAQLDEDGLWTDEQIGKASAADLIAYVTQNPDERARVRTLEEARPSKGKGKPGFRVSVMSATEPTPEADAEAEAEQAARKDGATPSEPGDANQGNDAPGSSPSGAETVTT